MTPNPDSVAVLRECPFCGGEPRREHYPAHKHHIAPLPDYPGAWSVECDACEFQIFSHDSQEAADAKWNRRHPAPPGSAVDELTCRTLLANFARDWNVLPPAECAEILARSMKAALASRTGKGEANV